MSDATSEAPAPALDWSTITTPVECPLCLYNLRGLNDPRCPECGLAFEWPELLDPTRQKHPYLFEHHPRRNFWSLRRTLFAGLLTRKFWAALKPTHTINPRRLLIYWLLCSCLVLIAPAAQAIQVGANLAQYNAWNRVFPGPPGTTNGKWPSPQARQQYVNANFPVPPSRGFFRQYAERVKTESLPTAAVELGTILAWPWLTVATLMIFQASMRKAKDQRAHILRVVIYASDASVCYAFLVLAAMSWLIAKAIIKRSPQPTENIMFWLVIVLWLMRLDRLTSAYRKYLHFDHPFLTALASQIITLLATAGILYCGVQLMRWLI